MATPLIVTALVEESRRLERRLVGRVRRTGAAPATLTSGRLAGHPVHLLTTGPGRDRARSRTVRAVECLGDVSRALVMGFGGALVPTARTGDVLLADEVIAAAEPARILRSCQEALERLTRASPSGFRLLRGRLVTTDSVVGQVGDKERLGVATGAVMVDMETAGVADALDGLGVPTVCIRAVVDELADELAAGLERLIDREGRPRPSRIAALLATRPWRVATLIRLGRRSQRAARHLEWIASRWVDPEGTDGPSRQSPS